MNKTELQKYIAEAYSTAPDFPWESTPDAAVYRHENNRKWFALVMTIPKARLGIRSDEMIDIVNLKCDPLLVGSLRSEPGIFPAYHMNKEHWNTIILSDKCDEELVKELLELSYELTCK